MMVTAVAGGLRRRAAALFVLEAARLRRVLPGAAPVRLRVLLYVEFLSLLHRKTVLERLRVHRFNKFFLNFNKVFVWQR